MLRIVRLMLLLPLALLPISAQAQVAPSATKPLSVSGYAMASAADESLNYGESLGGSGGFVVEHSPWLQLDARGVLIVAREPIHTLLGEIGPRVSHRFGMITAYGEGLGGLAHSEYLISLPHNEGKGFGIDYTVAVGADLRLEHGFSWRVADFSYTHIYVGTGVSPEIVSSGIMYRFF